MSNIKVTAFLLMAAIFVSSCMIWNRAEIDSKTLRPPHSGLFPIKQNNRMGYIDVSGNVVIKPQFELADDFFEDLAAVYINGKAGFIDKTGKVVIEPRFKTAQRFSEGYALVRVEDQVGVIDKSGSFVIPPQFGWERGFEFFSEGLAPVQVGEKFGYVDPTGKFIIQPRFSKALPFSNGIAVVMESERNDERCGCIDKVGKLVIWPSYDHCGPFLDGRMIIDSDIFDRFGSRVPEERPLYLVLGSFREGLTVACEGERQQRTYDKLKCGYVDTGGKIVITPRFDLADNFSEGLASVTFIDTVKPENSKEGYIDKTGNIIITPQFRQAGAFWGGLAPVEMLDGRSGYIDKSGKIVWQSSNKGLL